MHMMLTRVTVLILCLTAAWGQPFNETSAFQSVAFAGASYCVDAFGASGLSTWSCHACLMSGVNVTAIELIHTPATDSNAFVGYEPTADRIILGIAGTDPLNVQSWLDDLDFTVVAYVLHACPGCQVHVRPFCLGSPLY